MQAFMTGQMGRPRYRYSTYIALKLHRTFVTTHMTFIRGFMLKHCWTHLARICLSGTFMLPQMFTELKFRFETLSAILATDDQFTMVLLPMAFQITQFNVGEIAFIAFIFKILRTLRLFVRMMLRLVGSQKGLTGEVFVAKFAFVVWILFVVYFFVFGVRFQSLETLPAIFATVVYGVMINSFLVAFRIFFFRRYNIATLFYNFDFDLRWYGPRNTSILM